VKRRLSFFAFIVIVTAVAMLACSGGDSFVLRYSMPTGTTLSYVQIMDRSVKVTEHDSLVRDTTEHYRTEFTQLCVFDSKDSVYQISQKEFWYVAKNDSSGGDTLKWENAMFLTVKPNGRLIELIPAKDEEKSSASYVKNMMEQGTPVFPSEKLKVGSKWTQSTRVVFPDDTLEASTTFLVARIVMEGKYRCAVIEYSGNLILPMEESPMDTLKRSGVDYATSRGESWYAIDGGFPVKTIEKWHIKGERKKVVKGEVVPYAIAVDSDVSIVLKDASSPALAHK
jgi:hypothetical protein